MKKIILLVSLIFIFTSCTQETQNKLSRSLQNWTGTAGVLEVYAGEKLVKRFEANKDVIICFGIGYYLQLLSLKYADKKIIIIEPDKNLFNIILKFIDITLFKNIEFYIGFDDFAIIDFHIIDILVNNNIIQRPNTITKNKYLQIEDTIRKLAKKTNLTLAEIDLYLWYIETGRILK